MSAAVLAVFLAVFLRPTPNIIINNTPDDSRGSINQKNEVSALEKISELSKDSNSTLECENAINSKKAIYELCLSSAKKGNMKAIYFLGEDRYSQNLYQEAEKWYLLNANKGDYSSIYGLVQTYEKLGDNVLRTKWLKQCANTYYGVNEYSPKNILARCKVLYGMDLNNEGKTKQALLYFRDALNYGDSDGAVFLGMHYRNLGDKDTAKKWFLKGAELDNDVAISELVYALNEDGDSSELLKILTTSANKNNIQSTLLLAKQYLRAEDFANAKKWLLKCSQLAECSHIHGVILIYQDKNFNLGKQYLIKAANENHIPAMNELGRILWSKDKDAVNAEKWLQKSSIKNDYRGSNMLMALYLQQMRIEEACVVGVKIKTLAKDASARSTWDESDQKMLESANDFVDKFCPKL